MKKHLIIISEVLSLFRYWLHRKEPHPRHTDLRQTDLRPIATPEEVLHLCCNLILKTEKQVRMEVKELNPYTVKKVVEENTSLRIYKGLQIESQEYALWCEFFKPDGKPRSEKESLSCQTVLLFFHDQTKVDSFLHALKVEEHFQCIWDHCWVYPGEETIRIALEMAKAPELPHCLTFYIWGRKIK